MSYTVSLLSLLSSRLKGRLDENRELILYSSRSCLHTLPHYWSYYLTPLPVLLLPTPQFLLPHPPLPLTTSHIPGTMAHNMEHLPIIYLEPASKLDPTHHSYLFYSKFTFFAILADLKTLLYHLIFNLLYMFSYL